MRKILVIATLLLLAVTSMNLWFTQNPAATALPAEAAEAAIGGIYGFGVRSYPLGLDALLGHLDAAKR